MREQATEENKSSRERRAWSRAAGETDGHRSQAHACPPKHSTPFRKCVGPHVEAVMSEDRGRRRSSSVQVEVDAVPRSVASSRAAIPSAPSLHSRPSRRGEPTFPRVADMVVDVVRDRGRRRSRSIMLDGGGGRRGAGVFGKIGLAGGGVVPLRRVSMVRAVV